MDLHLTDEQAEFLLAALDRIIENDRYPLSPRIQARGARDPRAAYERKQRSDEQNPGHG